MKDLSIYFSHENDLGEYKRGQLGEAIEMIKGSTEDLSSGAIALITVPEYRNSQIESNEEWMTDFRRAFNQLFSGRWEKTIYDLGTILPGESIQDTYSAVRDVCAELIKNDILPILVGGSQDLTLALYQAYEKLEQTINLVAVDPSLDLGDPDKDVDAEGWLNKIILHKPNYLFNFSLIGYQSYLVNPGEIDLLDKLYFDSFRLGSVYSNHRIVEPLVRNADILSFDFSSIRSSDFSSNPKALPHGLYGEDACRIMRYAGLSDKLTSLGLFNFCSSSTTGVDVNLLAQMIWYFIEGVESRKQDYPIGSKSTYLKYRVNIDDFKDEIIFYKSDKSARWWMEVPYPKLDGVKLQRHLLVPCDYEDYENALNNELPDLWLQTYKKLV